MAEDGKLVGLTETFEIRNEVYDADPTLTLPRELVRLLDTLETLGGPGYEIACAYQELLVQGFPTEAVTRKMLARAEEALQQFGAA